ncbi:MBL fold metallo-hydrolase [Celeribacter arenosi]|uniref:MBL fold metallo-hydrolase n=1 Tax=Celeribacter arenosi TaxID=792649 RepID=A0ABP7KEJ7_9RHOB
MALKRPEQITQMDRGLWRVLADNPSPMTFWGTNSFVLGDRASRIVIDPGPDLASHHDALIEALSGAKVDAILVTHAHLDHSAGASMLAEATGAPVLAFGSATDGRSDIMNDLAASGALGGGEGVDHAFRPDQRLGDGEILDTPCGTVTAWHTPGHMAGHLCFAWRDVLFCGDHIMGWSSSLISPPDGDAAAFRNSCMRLKTLAPARMLPAHGDEIEDPAQRIDDLLAHRGAREASIIEALRDGMRTLNEITMRVYTDIPQSHLPAASRNTFAHLIDLVEQNRVSASPTLGESATFTLL